MLTGLEEKRIVIVGSRKLRELSEIIERQGGTPIVRSQQGILVLQEHELERDLSQLIESGTDWSIFTTGTGLEALLRQAGRLGVYDRLLELVKNSKIGARGYKTFALLKQLGIQPIAVDEDGTMEGLIRSLKAYDFSGQGVMVQLHGEPMPSFVSFLERKGAVVRTILPYQHEAPDPYISQTLCKEIAEASVDAVCFTTAVQVRYFFEYAKKHGHDLGIHQRLRKQVLAVAVGRVTADALKNEGVKRILVPQNERMGAMVIELARYYQHASAQRGWM